MKSYWSDELGINCGCGSAQRNTPLLQALSNLFQIKILTELCHFVPTGCIQLDITYGKQTPKDFIMCGEHGVVVKNGTGQEIVSQLLEYMEEKEGILSTVTIGRKTWNTDKPVSELKEMILEG